MFKIIHYLIVYSRNIDKKKRRQMLSIIRDMTHWFFRVFWAKSESTDDAAGRIQTKKKIEKDHYQKPISSRERRETEIFVSNPVINLEYCLLAVHGNKSYNFIFPVMWL
jgi:hypothetical protein